MHKKRRARLVDMKQRYDDKHSELEDTYNKNKELSQALEEATQVIKQQGEKEQSLLAALEEDSVHIDSLVESNKHLSTDLTSLKQIWTQANVPLLKSQLKELTASLHVSRQSEISLEEQLIATVQELRTTKAECVGVEGKARTAMDNAVRALNDAAVQTKSAEEELGAMRRSLREAKCYTLHTTLGRVVAAHKQEEARMSRMVSHLQAALNAEKSRAAGGKQNESTVGSFSSSPFVTLSGILEMSVSSSEQIYDVENSSYPGYGVVVNGRALYHFDNKKDCLDFFQDGSNSRRNSNCVKDTTRKLDLFNVVSVSVIETKEGSAYGICLMPATEPATSWKFFPESYASLMEWKGTLSHIVANNVKLVQLETGDAELLNNVNSIQLDRVGPEARLRLNAGNCFFNATPFNAWKQGAPAAAPPAAPAAAPPAAPVAVARVAPLPLPNTPSVPQVLARIGSIPLTPSSREAAMRALLEADMRSTTNVSAMQYELTTATAPAHEQHEQHEKYEQQEQQEQREQREQREQHEQVQQEQMYQLQERQQQLQHQHQTLTMVEMPPTETAVTNVSHAVTTRNVASTLGISPPSSSALVAASTSLATTNARLVEEAGEQEARRTITNTTLITTPTSPTTESNTSLELGTLGAPSSSSSALVAASTSLTTTGSSLTTESTQSALEQLALADEYESEEQQEASPVPAGKKRGTMDLLFGTEPTAPTTPATTLTTSITTTTSIPATIPTKKKKKKKKKKKTPNSKIQLI